MLTIKDEGVAGVINVPTSVEEITPEVLSKLTSNVILQKYYTIVALCWKVNLNQLLLNNKKDTSAKVISMIAKVNGDDDCNWIKPGKVAIINKSDIEMSTHLHVEMPATVSNIYNHYTKVAALVDAKAKGPNLAIIQKTPKDYFYLLEFKIVPVNAIKAIIDNFDDIEDPFAQE